MAMMQAKAALVGKALSESGAVGFDPAAILAILQVFITLFKGCLTPAQAQRRMQRLSRGEWYLGKNLDLSRLDGIILDSGVCGGGCGPADVRAAVIDVAGATTAAEYAALYGE